MQARRACFFWTSAVVASRQTDRQAKIKSAAQGKMTEALLLLPGE